MPWPRAGHETEQVVRRERLDLGTVVQHIFDAQTARADVLTDIILVEFLILNFA